MCVQGCQTNPISASTICPEMHESFPLFRQCFWEPRDLRGSSPMSGMAAISDLNRYENQPNHLAREEGSRATHFQCSLCPKIAPRLIRSQETRARLKRDDVTPTERGPFKHTDMQPFCGHNFQGFYYRQSGWHFAAFRPSAREGGRAEAYGWSKPRLFAAAAKCGKRFSREHRRPWTKR